MKIADIRIGTRHRRDMRDLAGLADDIRVNGLLQPIGITPERDLVFGERRLRACRDVLGWIEIDVRIVNLPSIVAGEFAENEMREDFTASERVAIMASMERSKGGRPSITETRPDRGGFVEPSKETANQEIAAKRAGFGSVEAARRATLVTRRGIPELIAAMDAGELKIDPAAVIAVRPAEEQREIMTLDRAARTARIAALREERKLQDAKLARTKMRKGIRQPKTITIVWSAAPAARELMKAWPRSLVTDLWEELGRRLDATTKQTGSRGNNGVVQNLSADPAQNGHADR